jgi:hypothetical protein
MKRAAVAGRPFELCQVEPVLLVRGLRFISVMLGVEFRRFAGMMSGMLGVALRGVRMVSCGFVIAGLMLLSGFTMMTCCVLVMLCRLIVMVRCFLRHIESPWIANNWASRPEARVACRLRAGTYAVSSTPA